MAYQVDIEFDFDRTPFEDAFGGQSLRFILGHDLTAEIMVVMDVAFICKERGIYDLRFGVGEYEISLSREGFYSPPPGCGANSCALSRGNSADAVANF